MVSEEPGFRYCLCESPAPLAKAPDKNGIVTPFLSG